MGRLVFARYEYYGWFDLVAEDRPQGFTFEPTDEYHKFTSRELVNGPGRGTYHVFSHYSDRVAFWTDAGTLWVSDIAYRKPEQILLDQSQKHVPEERNLTPWGDINLIWSPDDQNLFVYNLDPTLGFIYHVETGQLEEWYWQCDSLIISTQSGRLATLCSKIIGVAAEEETYAVLEWGGEIWFSDTLPGELFLEPLSDGTAFWQWSANGQQVAYFDPNDPGDHLFIADIQGNTRKLLSGISPFQDSEIAGYQQYEFLSAETPFLWSRDGSLLLVDGLGQADSPCPPLISEEADPPLVLTWDCWQAVDVNTGQVIWSEVSLLGNLSLDNGGEPVQISVDALTVAPIGRFVAVRGTITSYPVIVIVDLHTSQVTTISQFDRFKRIYWGGRIN